jgi:hypothetical protein
MTSVITVGRPPIGRPFDESTNRSARADRRICDSGACRHHPSGIPMARARAALTVTRSRGYGRSSALDLTQGAAGVPLTTPIGRPGTGPTAGW